MAFPANENGTKDREASSRGENTIHDLWGRGVCVQDHLNHMWIIQIQMRERHVFLCPTFWDLSFDFIFKTLICACERARGLAVDTAWLVQE